MLKRFRRPAAQYSIIERGDDYVVIQDQLPWFGKPTITNDAENVVHDLLRICPVSTIFYYIDSNGDKGRLRHDGRGFTGFWPMLSDLEIMARALWKRLRNVDERFVIREIVDSLHPGERFKISIENEMLDIFCDTTGIRHRKNFAWDEMEMAIENVMDEHRRLMRKHSGS